MNKNRIINGVLVILIAASAYLLYNTLNSPIEFNKQVNTRSAEVEQKLKDIRIIQRAYKAKFGRFSDDFDRLVYFIENDSLEYQIAMGSEDDSVAVARGLVTTKTISIPASDTLFSGRVVNFKDLPYVPYGNGAKFKLGTANITTESGVEVNVFEASVSYETFLGDLDKQSLINLKDKRDTERKYVGIRVGSLEKANNDAGSWEE